MDCGGSRAAAERVFCAAKFRLQRFSADSCRLGTWHIMGIELLGVNVLRTWEYNLWLPRWTFSESIAWWHLIGWNFLRWYAWLSSECWKLSGSDAWSLHAGSCKVICMVELKTLDCVHGGAESAGEWLSAEKVARMVSSMGSSPKELWSYNWKSLPARRANLSRWGSSVEWMHARQRPQILYRAFQ